MIWFKRWLFSALRKTSFDGITLSNNKTHSSVDNTKARTTKTAKKYKRKKKQFVWEQPAAEEWELITEKEEEKEGEAEENV